MKAEAQLRVEGMSALIAALGTVEAERFITSIVREKFDYTQWRRQHLPAGSVTEISQRASVSTLDSNLPV